jgi:hypothetical protein
MDNTQRIDRIVAIATAILLTAGCIVVLYPFVSALLWAVILCFVTWPTFLWGVRLLGGRRTMGGHADGAAGSGAAGGAIRGCGPQSGG